MALELSQEDKKWIKDEVYAQLKNPPEALKEWIREEVRQQLAKSR